MFQLLMDLIQSVEQSKREVELRIKARADEVRAKLKERKLESANSTGRTVPFRSIILGPHRKGRTMYTSGSRFLNR